MKKLTAIIVIGATGAVVLTGCSHGNAGTQEDKKVSNAQLERYQKNQPIPQSDWSQYRQTVIDIEQAQIHGVATTTFFYNQGSNRPVKSCPSIGFPVATTSQLTNPEQTQTHGSDGIATIGQLEPNGVYTGDSTGTYVVCVASGGAKEITYWEGFVETEGGAAHYDSKTGQIVLDGEPTVVTKTK